MNGITGNHIQHLTVPCDQDLFSWDVENVSVKNQPGTIKFYFVASSVFFSLVFSGSASTSVAIPAPISFMSSF